MKTCCRPQNKHMENFGQAVLLLAAFATTIAWLLKERRYRFHLYITRKTDSVCQTFHFTSTFRALLRSELQHILEEARFVNIRWVWPSYSGFYQPRFVGD